MIRLSALSGYLLAVAAGTALFWTSQTVQSAQDRLDRIRADLARERESLHVLHAEWDYLNRPERIEMLARKYLGMEPAGTQALIARAQDIPEPALAETDVGFAESHPDGDLAFDSEKKSGEVPSSSISTLASLSVPSTGQGRRR